MSFRYPQHTIYRFFTCLERNKTATEPLYSFQMLINYNSLKRISIGSPLG